MACDQSPAMCEAMRKVGAGCELITIEGSGQGMSGWRVPEMQHWKSEMVIRIKSGGGRITNPPPVNNLVNNLPHKKIIQNVKRS